MKLERVLFFFAVSIAGCHAPPPEGVYDCTRDTDCFAGWTCRADLHCWSQPAPVDAGFDSATDTSTCVVETCNGRDDDCDGLIDEGALRVGAAVPANPTPDPQPNYFGALITPLTNGFVVFGTSNNMATSGGWSTLDLTGARRAMMPSTAQSYFLDAASFGDQVVVSGFDPPTAAFGLFTFDFADGTTARSFLPIGTSPDDLRVSFITGFDGTVAHVFEFGSDATGNFIRRGHVDTTGPTVTDVLIATDVHSSAEALYTSATDYLVYANSAHELRLWQDDHVAFSSLGVITTTSESLTGVQLAIRDAQRPVSGANPILVVWATANGVVSLVEITNTTDSASFAMLPIRIVNGTRGPVPPTLLPTQTIAIVPAPFDSSTDPSHWLVATIGNDGGSPALSIVQVFEVTDTTVREIVVADESYVERLELGLAVSQGHIRLAEAGNAGGIVTRAIGCE